MFVSNDKAVVVIRVRRTTVGALQALRTVDVAQAVVAIRLFYVRSLLVTTLFSMYI